MKSSRTGFAVGALVAPFLLVSTVLAAPASAAPYTVGNVFVSVGQGLVKEFTPSGTVVQTLDTTTAVSETTGSAFDAAGNFYVTDFAGNQVTKFDTNGTLVGPFGSGYNADPESIVFDAVGNAYVGQADGSHDILKFDSSGTLIGTFSPTITDRGTDWIDLAADQCTIYYDSEGPNVHRFNVCTNTQLADFNTSPLPGAYAFALRILPDGGVLVANTSEVVRLDNTGAVVQTYTAPGDGYLFALNLDADGTTFWTADLGNGDVVHFNIATGAVLGNFNGLSDGGNDVAGLSVRGELTAAHQYNIALTPATDSAPAGGTHTVTATTTDTGAPLAGQSVSFSITAGPNTGATGTGTTNASGQATFTYTDTGGAGTDTIAASFTDPAAVTLHATPVTMTWTPPTVNQPPLLTTANGSVQYSDAITPFNVSATDPENDPLTLSASGLPATLIFTDNHNGTGTVSGTATATPAVYTVTYSASDGTNPTVTATGTVTVTKEDCTLTMPSTVLSSATGPTVLTASMGESDASLGDRSNKTITFAGLDSSLTAVGPFTATTDASGNASASAALGAGVYSINAAFAGDSFYNPCGTTSDTIVTVSPAKFKVTGGGWISNGVGRTSFGFNAVSDVTGLHGQLQIRTENKGNFHGNVVLTLSGTGTTAQWTGTGSWKGVSGYKFTVAVVDAGTSGKKGDTISITIKNPAGTSTVFNTGAAVPLKGGNIVVH